ncbi:hypothetical protein OAG68_02380 [bacterium]|nr:hypothetical protein [bacterium]
MNTDCFTRLLIGAIATLFLCTSYENAEGQEEPEVAQEELFEWDGCSNLDDWESSKDDGKDDWTINADGQLVCGALESNIFRRMVDLPEVVEIELEVSWDRNLDMVFGMGAPKEDGPFPVDPLPRIESWEDALVFSLQENFFVVKESISPDTKSLSLHIRLDRGKGNAIVRDTEGKLLVAAKGITFNENVVPGFVIQNKNGDLTVRRLVVREVKKKGGSK